MIMIPDSNQVVVALADTKVMTCIGRDVKAVSLLMLKAGVGSSPFLTWEEGSTVVRSHAPLSVEPYVLTRNAQTT